MGTIGATAGAGETLSPGSLLCAADSAQTVASQRQIEVPGITIKVELNFDDHALARLIASREVRNELDGVANLRRP